MSRVVSFSVDNQFADELVNLVQTSGYDNRSRFLRDASLHFAEELQRGSLESMDSETAIEGTTGYHGFQRTAGLSPLRCYCD